MNEEVEKVLSVLKKLEIPYDYYEHPEVLTINEARLYWNGKGTHCKNIFFRNHKGNKHYLIVFDHEKELPIKQFELLLKEGKLSFASAERLMKYLGVKQGAVSPFGLINDTEKHVFLFLDEDLKKSDFVSFHPNYNGATVTIPLNSFIKYLDSFSFEYQFIKM